MAGPIDLDHFPAAAVDVAAVRAAAAGMAPLGPAVADSGERAVRAWRQVGTYYVAPETPVLLGALDPVPPATRRTADRVTGLGRALAAYADQAEPLIAELRALAAATAPTPEQAARADALMAELLAVERDCAAAIRALSAFDPRPDKLRVAEQVDRGAVGVTVGFVRIGDSALFKETTFSDGSVFLTAVDAGELGATGSLGGLIDLGAGVRIEAGSTWRFRTAAEAAALREQLAAYVAQQRAVLFDDSGGAAAGVAIFGGVPAPRPPDQVVSEFAVPLSAAATVDAGVAQAGVGAEGTVKQTVIRDLATGATTTVLAREGSVEASVTATPLGAGPTAGAGLQRLTGSTTGVTRDATGRITKVLLGSTESVQGSSAENLAGPRPDPPGGRHRAPSLDPTGTVLDEQRGSRVTVTTTSLDVTDANRAAVERWVADGQPDGDGAVGDPARHYPDTAVPGDAFQNALHEGAKVTRVSYADVTDTAGIDAEVKAGWTLGVEVTGEHTSSRAGTATYLDAPGPDGTRRPVPLPVPPG